MFATLCVFGDIVGKLVDGKVIAFLYFVPALRLVLAHDARATECLDDVVGVKVVVLAAIDPRGTIDFLECSTKFLSFTSVVNTTFQTRELKIGAVEPTALVIHFGKNACDRTTVLIERTLNAHVKEDSVSRHACRALRFGGKRGILKTRSDILNRGFARRLAICEQIAEHL